MSTTQETCVTSSQDRCTTVEVAKKSTKINGETKAEIDGAKSTVEDLFPWITEFKKKCRSLIAQPNIVALIRLMKFYARNVNVNVNECYTKPYRAAKLKDSISETLLFFLYYFRELVEVCDKNSYLDKMSDLLAMYMDMELKASRRGKEHHSKIAARLTSCLYVYLENSSEHILDTFIKARFINRNYHDILDPVLTKIFKSISVRPNCDTMYVRYLLIYRLWKKVNNDAAVKNQINATAILHLGSPPPCTTPFLAKYVLPKVPKSQANSTKFLLLHKFDIEKSCRLFIQYCKENREDEDQGDLDKPNFIVNTPSSDTLDTLKGSGMCRGTIHVDNLIDNVNILPETERRQRTTAVKTNLISGETLSGKFTSEECLKAQKNMGKHDPLKISQLKPFKANKVLPRLKTKKNGDILFIDLTADEITEKVIKKKKQRKLHWLTEVKKKLNAKNLKASEKKKKAQTIANNSSDDLTVSGLVDSTSTRSLSTATTPEPLICSAIDPDIVKSLSTATTPEPENCVTSNSAENDLPLTVNSSNEKMSEFVEKQPACAVTTTVIESVPLTSNKLGQNLFETSDSAPNCANDSFGSKETIAKTANSNQMVNQSPINSCHTTSEENKVHIQKSEAWAIAKLSSALSHICESYDSDNSALDVGSDEKVDSELDKKVLVESENMSVKQQEVNKDSEKSAAQRTSSESSDVAVIYTRRASDVDIVDLDDYNEDNSGIYDPESIERDVCLSTGSVIDKNSRELEDAEFLRNKSTINNIDIRDLALRTNELKLTNSGDNESKKVAARKNGAVNEGSFNYENALKLIDYEGKFDLQTANNDQTIEATDVNKAMNEVEQEERLESDNSQIEGNNLEKLNPLQLVDYDVKKLCDYKSSKGERLGDIKLTASDAMEIRGKQDPGLADEETQSEIVEKVASSIQSEYVEEQTSIPKINEILNCSKNVEEKILNISNDLLTSQEPRFNDNIDGLSLLASVSQHVSHLEEYTEKSSSKPKIINRVVSRENSELKNVFQINSSVIKEVNTADSYELLLDLNTDTSSEIINEIVGVPQQINQPKFGNYERCGSAVTDNDSLDVVPLILETTVDLNSSTLHNNLIPVENVTQMIKDTTNVIVNGETVVLFQKSPNSNLYIINKAIDSTMECLGDDKKGTTKNMERNSTTMRDIINHIPINLSEKSTDRQDLGKANRPKASACNKNRSDPRKLDNSAKNYENQMFSKQLKPVREKLLQHGDKIEDQYIKKEIVNADGYEDTFRQRCTDTPGSVVELELVKRSPPPVIRLTDTPIDVKMLKNQEEVREESTALDMATSGRLNGNLLNRRTGDKREGTSNENNLTFKKSIKQEFQSCADNLSNKVSSHSGIKVSNDSQHFPRQINANINPNNLFPANSNQSSKIPHAYSTVTTASNLYSIEHEHCNYSSCSLKVSSAQSYHQSISQSVPTCQLSHCACLKCAYEVHCRQYIQRPPATVSHSSYHQTNSYFLSADSSEESCAVHETELKLNEAALAKMKDDQLLHNIEQSIIDNKHLNEANVKTVAEIKYKPEFDSKLPLKKRLKAHAMLSMSYEDAPIKIEKVENYPGTPMMSIAALEARNIPQNTSPFYGDKHSPPSSALELSPRLKDDSLSQHTTEMIRRDYLKDTSLTSIGNCANVDERVRKLEQQRRQTSSQVNIMAMGCQRSFKTPAQRKEVIISSPSSLKRAATTSASHPKSPKKGKKMKITSNVRQTRSSKRNIPKVDYSYDGIIDSDPKFNTLSELRRKRKKTSR